MTRFLPFLDLRAFAPRDVAADTLAALGIVFLAVPQGVAYAMIAGLPPAMGLYAAAIPTIVGSLMRSSRHVVSGPTNAVSLLVGGVVAAGTGDPVAAGTTIALTVGLLQATAGFAGLGAIVDYISGAVVLGYITGAGVLIGVGQLTHVTATPPGRGHLGAQLVGWVDGLGAAHGPSVAIAAATVLAIVALRRLSPRSPVIVLAMGAGIVAAWGLDLGAHGVRLVRDLAPVPAGLPPFTVPDLGRVDELLSVSVAAALLSLVESAAVARSLAGRTGQRVDTSVDFAGQGLANLTAAFSGGYAVSGSLSRSAFNERAGARSRLAGALSGVLMVGVLVLFGPVVDWTPIPCLAGILLVMAVDLVDRSAIREVLRSDPGDRLAFLVTVVGTWVLPLDRAILLGVGISIAIFLRRVRHVLVTELVIDDDGALREADPAVHGGRSPAIKLLHVEGNLFFGAASELERELHEATRDDPARVIVVRLKRTQGLDLTTARALSTVHRALEAEGRHMLLVGMRPMAMQLLQDTGIAASIGSEDLFPTEPGWFVAMDRALARALELTDAPDDCPVRRYLTGRHARRDGGPAHA